MSSKAVRRFDLFRERHLMEYLFSGPYCWEQTSMVLGTSVRGQTFVEDCEVCCHPITWPFSVPHHIFDTDLADPYAELEQLTVDMRVTQTGFSRLSCGSDPGPGCRRDAAKFGFPLPPFSR